MKRRRPKMKAIVILFLVFLFIGITFCAVAFLLGRREARIRNLCPEEARAYVVDYQERWSTMNEGRYMLYAPVFVYTVRGQEFTAVSTIASSPPQYEVGQEVTIKYNPHNSTEFYEPDNTIGIILCIVFGVVGLAMLCIDVLLLVLRMLRVI